MPGASNLNANQYITIAAQSPAAGSHCGERCIIEDATSELLGGEYQCRSNQEPG